MIITLEEMKQYLRVDFSDDDEVLTDIMDAAMRLCMAIARVGDEESFSQSKNAKIAVM